MADRNSHNKITKNIYENIHFSPISLEKLLGFLLGETYLLIIYIMPFAFIFFMQLLLSQCKSKFLGLHIFIGFITLGFLSLVISVMSGSWPTRQLKVCFYHLKTFIDKQGVNKVNSLFSGFYHWFPIEKVLRFSDISKFFQRLHNLVDFKISLCWLSHPKANLCHIYAHYLTPSGIPVKVLEAEQFGKEPSRESKLFYGTFSGILAVYDYFHRDLILATARFYPEIFVLLILAIAKTFYGTIIPFWYVLFFSSILLSFIVRMWLFSRLIAKLRVSYYILSEEITEYYTHPYLETLIRQGFSKEIIDRLSWWRIILPFLHF